MYGCSRYLSFLFPSPIGEINCWRSRQAQASPWSSEQTAMMEAITQIADITQIVLPRILMANKHIPPNSAIATIALPARCDIFFFFPPLFLFLVLPLLFVFISSIITFFCFHLSSFFLCFESRCSGIKLFVGKEGRRQAKGIQLLNTIMYTNLALHNDVRH